MNNYFAGNAVCVKLMDKLGCCVQKVKKACHMKKEGSAVIGEVLVMIVVVAMAALFHKIYEKCMEKKEKWRREYALMHVGNVVSGYGDVFRA